MLKWCLLLYASESIRADVTLKGPVVSVRGERSSAEGFRWAKMAAALPPPPGKRSGFIRG